MRFVGDDDDVPAIGEHRVGALAGLGCKLLDSGEHHAARRAGQRLLQILPAFRLLRGLAEQITAHGKRAEQLVVEVVAVGDDDNGRISPSPGGRRSVPA